MYLIECNILYRTPCVMPRISGAEQWADPSKQYATQRGMVARGHLMPVNTGKSKNQNNSRTGKKEKLNGGIPGGCTGDHRQMELGRVQAVLGSGVCSWVRREAGRRTRKANCRGNRGLEAGSWRIAGSQERGITGAGNPGRKHGNGTRKKKIIRRNK